MSKKTFLIEIGIEELPPKSLRRLAESFSTHFSIEMNHFGFNYDNIKWFATPRRLALKVEHLSFTYQIDRKLKKHNPIPPIKKFNFDNQSADSINHLVLSYNPTFVNQKTSFISDERERSSHCFSIEVLPKIIKSTLEKLPIKKSMYYGTNNECFIRPIHTLTLLLEEQVIPATILGIKSDRIVHGHRFMGEMEFTIDHADQYPQILMNRGKVIADYEQRKAKIKSDVEEAARQIGGNVDLNNDLLEEVTSLVEWPVVLIAKFEEKFLNVPTEVLVHIMKDNQKYFPIYSISGNLLPNFIFVTNIESKDPQKIISGNEKVMRARLSDAEFFFKVDRKKRLEDYLPDLRNVLFHHKLGTLHDRTGRIQFLSGWIAKQIGADINQSVRAGLLSKCDLMTKMVFEYPSLQGIIGMHYARFDGELENVAITLKEQYHPRFLSDVLPSNPISYTVSIADKMDTLVGILGIGQYPKSSKDPFALRRAAYGILRILIEKNLRLDLRILAEESARLYGNQLTNANVTNDVVDFMLDRLRPWYQYKGYSTDIIQAVLACRPTCPSDFNARVQAISYFRTLELSEKLTTVNKRISNILEKSDESLNEFIYTSILKEEAEVKLARNLTILHDKLKSYLSQGEYQNALIELTSLHEVVDEFFENVIVNIEDKSIRINRLTLLAKLRELFLQIADISLLK